MAVVPVARQAAGDVFSRWRGLVCARFACPALRQHPLDHLDVLVLDHVPSVVCQRERASVLPQAVLQVRVRVQRTQDLAKLVGIAIVEPAVTDAQVVARYRIPICEPD